VPHERVTRSGGLSEKTAHLRGKDGRPSWLNGGKTKAQRERKGGELHSRRKISGKKRAPSPSKKPFRRGDHGKRTVVVGVGEAKAVFLARAGTGRPAGRESFTLTKQGR